MNLIDRVFRGFVVDYIEPLFIDFAIFNFADILVTCSAVVLVVWTFYDIYRENKKEKELKKLAWKFNMLCQEELPTFLVCKMVM